jgi:hypothetical protein
VTPFCRRSINTWWSGGASIESCHYVIISIISSLNENTITHLLSIIHHKKKTMHFLPILFPGVIASLSFPKVNQSCPCGHSISKSG